ncbi:hypothetical protein GCM10027570_45630 [Streptomonospora sediminis]
MSGPADPAGAPPAAAGEPAKAPTGWRRVAKWLTPATILAAVTAAFVVGGETMPKEPVSAELGRALPRIYGTLNSVAFSPDGTLLATASASGTAYLWDTASGREVAAFRHGDVLFSVAFAPDGETLATGGRDGTAHLWDTATGREITTVTAAAGPPPAVAGDTHVVFSVAFNADGTVLATGGHDTVQLWDTATGQKLRAFDGTEAAFSPDGAMLAYVGADDSTVRVVDTGTWRQAATLDAQKVNSVAFSPDGTMLATTSAQHGPRSESDTARVWDTGTGRKISTLSGPDFGVAAVAFAPDGGTIAAASSYARGADRFSVRLVDTGSWEETTTLIGEGDRVNSVAFAPDGTTLATGGGGLLFGTATLWDIGGHVS